MQIWTNQTKVSLCVRHAVWTLTAVDLSVQSFVRLSITNHM